MFALKMIAVLALSASAPLMYFGEATQDSKMRKCAEVCAACQVECDSCFDHCPLRRVLQGLCGNMCSKWSIGKADA